MDDWFFDENLSHNEILERAEKEFGIKASQQTLTAYFRHRERFLNLPDGVRNFEPEEENALATRVGAGMDWRKLELKTLHFASMAAYEMALAEPGEMRVREIQSLMKMINERQRLWLDRKLRTQRLELQQTALLEKIRKDRSTIQTKEEYEQTLMAAADMWNRAKQRCAENRAGMAAERGKPLAESQGGGRAQTSARPGGETDNVGEGDNTAADEGGMEEGGPNGEVKPGGNDGEFNKDT